MSMKHTANQQPLPVSATLPARMLLVLGLMDPSYHLSPALLVRACYSVTVFQPGLLILLFSAG